MVFPVFIGMGSNEGDSQAILQHALDRIGQLPDTQLDRVSPTYWTPPWGVSTPQADYLNAVVLIRTSMAPHDLLMALQVIESDLGRVRSKERYAPRTLDLDLLVYGAEVIEDEVLTVPHPRLSQRAFVLIPLSDLAPNAEIPSMDRVDYLIDALDDDAMDGIRPAHIQLRLESRQSP